MSVYQRNRMTLSIWLYTHRHGTDVLKIFVPEGVKLSAKDVIKCTGIDWEPDADESLEHDADLLLGVLDDTVTILVAAGVADEWAPA